MLRRSTGCSEEINRVEVPRGMEILNGEENRKCVATARLTSSEAEDDASSEVVGIAGLSPAMDCRRSRSGSCRTLSGAAILAFAAKVMQAALSGAKLVVKLKRS
jgi:hypothetical protein